MRVDHSSRGVHDPGSIDTPDRTRRHRGVPVDGRQPHDHDREDALPASMPADLPVTHATAATAGRIPSVVVPELPAGWLPDVAAHRPPFDFWPSCEPGDPLADPPPRRVPSAALIDNLVLSGSRRPAVDRAAADRVLATAPQVRPAVWAQRDFLGRVVRYLANMGITQFLDLGSGLPAFYATHEIAQELTPAARVVYVDNDPIAAYCGAELLAGNPLTAMVRADLRDFDMIINSGAGARLLDFGQPVAIVLTGALHFLPGPLEDLARLLAEMCDALMPGSHLVFTHAVHDPATAALAALYADTPTPLHPRRHHDLTDLWARQGLCGGDLVPLDECRPDPPDPDEVDPHGEDTIGYRNRTSIPVLAGVGRRQ